ncbi:MAG: TlyA family RNA methyltransferase [Chloroflexota bacterium]|nr:MAG: TlyA family RNA methyltransferase [Chloroflexota bacterium]
MTRKKQRLDLLLVERGLVETRSQGRVLVMAGEVRVDGARAVKPSTLVSPDSAIEVVTPAPYVSRGGYKLAAALSQFNITVNDEVCADVGACTGGFTDVLLQKGAARVYAIDVGYGQIDWKLRRDSRVVVMERTNARHLFSLPEQISFASIDVSFISLRLILPAVTAWLVGEGQVVSLIKPQFEAGHSSVGKGGIVRSPAVHEQVLQDVLSWCAEHDLAPAGLIRSPITGADGNIEFLAWLRRGQTTAFDLDSAISGVLARGA